MPSQDQLDEAFDKLTEALRDTARSAMLVEREACAALVDDLANERETGTLIYHALRHAAAAIRNRGEIAHARPTGPSVRQPPP